MRVEGGAARIIQVGALARTAAVAGVMRRDADSAFASLISASATYARDSIAAMQAIGALAWKPSGESAWQLEGGATGAAFGLSAIGRGGNGSAYAHARRRLGDFSVWGGAALGLTIRDGESNHSTTVDAGATYSSGSLDVEATFSRVRSEDSLLFASSRIFMTRPAPYLDVQDVGLTARWTASNVELSATQVWRRGVMATTALQDALYVTAAWPITPRYAVAVTGGRLLADPVRGSPDAKMVMAVLRVTFAEPAAPEPEALNSVTQLLQASTGAVLVVRVQAHADAIVEVAGSYNDWQPVRMRRANGLFEAEIRLPSGRHRVAFRVDGGKWQAPGKLGKLQEFDGEVGFVIVP